jgi:hypothetical protein
MQTYSHFLLSVVLRKPAEGFARRFPRHVPPMRRGALLIGSILPDLPLTALGIVAIAIDMVGGAFNDPYFATDPAGTPAPPEILERSLTMRLFDVWFFENPWVITAHNLFHSPLLVAVYLLLGYWAWQQQRNWGSRLFWLAAAAMLHTLIDIPLHVTDGPLLLFPLIWDWRYIAPISYWDPNYFGREWAIFEHLLDLVFLLYLGYTWIQGRRKPAVIGGHRAEIPDP